MLERTAAPARRASAWPARLAAGALVAVGLAAATGFVWVAGRGPAGPAEGSGVAAAPAAAGGGGPFGTWPAGAPEVALVLSGQTYGYLSPCGCSRPQKGGLERRFNLVQGLKAKGWPVVGLDLGDVAPGKGSHGLHNHRQDLLKYKAAMRALADMGYAAVGLGEYDFSAQLFDLLAENLNSPVRLPQVVAANLLGAQRDNAGRAVKTYSRDEFFPGGPAGRPMVEAAEVVPAGRAAVGVVGVVGPDVAEQVLRLDKQFEFARAPVAAGGPPLLETAAAIRDGLARVGQHPLRPALRVLLYAGKPDQAKRAAEAFPQFQVVLCQSDDAEPPDFPEKVNGGKTLVVQVGHKGQNVGVVGAFPGPAGGWDLRYQRVPLTEDYLTPDGDDAAKANKALGRLEEYAAEVKTQNLLAAFRARPLPHPAQVQHPAANLTYVGAAACQGCHPNEYATWKGSRHSHAYEALEKATRPGLRQYDAECVVCHTTGFEYAGGFDDEARSAHLKHNGCENCHGPGSGHAADPKNPGLLAALAPWKASPTDRLPDLATLSKLAATKPIDRNKVPTPAAQLRVVNAVTGLCRRCHDGENDPKFEFYEYMPKIYHSGMKVAAAK